MILAILAVVAVILIVLVAVVAMQPSDFRISRTAAIAAPAAFLFEQINDLHLWAAWSPWERMDTDIKKNFEGPPSGVGAIYSWVGKKTGEGRMTTVVSQPNELIRFKLDFIKPFQANNIAEFTFKPEGNRTVVTWSMTGKNNFSAKAFGLLINMDKMCGTEFQKGLANLEEVAQAKTKLQTV